MVQKQDRGRSRAQIVNIPPKQDSSSHIQRIHKYQRLAKAKGGGGRRGQRIRQCVITVMCVINGFNNRWTERGKKKNCIYNNPHPFLIAYHY